MSDLVLQLGWKNEFETGSAECMYHAVGSFKQRVLAPRIFATICVNHFSR